jgi:DNA-binding NtrC family response regulator
MTSINILIVDDEIDFINRVKFGLKQFDFIKACSVEEAKTLINSDIDVIMLDLNLNPSNKTMEGLLLIDYFKKHFPMIPITIITGYGTVSVAVEAMKRGADDFLKKRDMDLIEWEKRLELLVKNKNLTLQKEAYEKEKYGFIGEAGEIINIKDQLERLGENSTLPVMIRGETGVGKEVAAKYLHSKGNRSDMPFVPVNINSIPSALVESALFGHRKGAFTNANAERIGYFKKANNGILFLDEIGDLNLETQGKLLRFLEDQTINPIGCEKEIKLDMQVVTATNKNLENLVKDNSFRSDLYYRVKGLTINIPPLRERKSDIPFLVYHFLKNKNYYDPEKMISDNSLSILKNYNWPGNIRELKHVIEYAIFQSRRNIISTEHLPKDIFDTNKININRKKNIYNFPLNFNEKVSCFQLDIIENALSSTYGNKSKAAELLGLNIDQIRIKIVNNRKIVGINNYPNICKYYNNIFDK